MTVSQTDPAVAQRLPTEPEAVFIVGASRSGTSLMRQLLERSPRIAIARENHFLGHLRKSEGARYYFRRAGDLADDATIRRIVEMIYSGEYQRQSRWRELSPYWRTLVEDIPREQVERALLAAERTERGLFAAFLRIYADRLGRPIFGEKTPAHLAYVPTLLEWFPTARVVHMIRDPRAVYVSDLRRRRKRGGRPFSWFARVPGLLPLVILVLTTLVWRAAVRRHVTYSRRYPTQYRLVRFEDVVERPEDTLRGLYGFLGVEMPAGATDVEVVSHGEKLGEQGLDADAASRWREKIGPFAKRWLDVALGGSMRRVGYSG